MKRSAKFTLGSLACVLIFAGVARAQVNVGPVQVTGTYQFIFNGAVGNKNPNNVGLTSRGGEPWLLLMEHFLDLTAYTRVSENLSLFAEPRVFWDLTKTADTHYIQYESVPDDFRGDGYMLRGGGNDAKYELWQVYGSYNKGNLFLRVGKQSVAWGNDVALRILDQVDSLDLSQNFFFGTALEEFSQTRIPEWMARLDYVIANNLIPDLTLELLASPGTWTPTILPSQGAPYNVVPSLLFIREDVHMGRPILGARLEGTAWTNTEFTLNFLTRPNSNGVVPRVSPTLDVPGDFPPMLPGVPIPIRLFGKSEHPRFYLWGGSLTQPLNRFPFTGILRLETTVITNSPFTYAAPAGHTIISRPVWTTFVGLDRPTRFFPNQDPMAITAQFEEVYTAGSLQHVQSAGANVDSHSEVLALVLQQPLFRQQVSLTLVALHDMAGGSWFQPNFHWQIGNHYAVDLLYNNFSGEKTSRFPAQFWWADGYWARFTYQF